MNITLYNFGGDRRTLDKFLTLIANVPLIAITDSTSILKPSILIETRSFNFNYVYIPAFNRYYYVDNIELVNGGRIRINLSVDVLMSHKTSINNSIVIAERSASNSDPDLPDTAINYKDNAEVKIYEHGTSPFNTNTYILNICGRG